MKKTKVTRKPGVGQEYVLRPSRLRMAGIYAFFFALAVVAGLFIRLAFSGGESSIAEVFNDWQINLAIVVGGAVLFALLDYSRWTLKVIGLDKVEGPTGAFGERTAIPIKEIDWPRSMKSLKSRLKVGNAIYTLSRRRILISPWFYDASAFSEFLARIGYNPEKK